MLLFKSCCRIELTNPGYYFRLDCYSCYVLNDMSTSDLILEAFLCKPQAIALPNPRSEVLLLWATFVSHNNLKNA